MQHPPVITVRDLRKDYGGAQALRGIALEVRAGELFALLGENGTGKTTTLEIPEGMSGEVSVLRSDR